MFVAERAVMDSLTEATRFIPNNRSSSPSISTSRSGGGIQFYRADLTPGREGVAGPDPEAGQRFASEIQYASFYAKRLANTMAMQSLELVMVEDGDFQTGFAFSRTDDRWHGFIASSRISLEAARLELGRR